MTEWLLPLILPGDIQKKAARSLTIGTDVPYIKAAERAISGALAGNNLLPGVGWHLEDPDGETVDEDYAGDPRAIEAYNLIAEPFAALDDVTSPLKTRRQLWEITSRHMGLAGYSFWLLNNMDDFGIPDSFLYIRPDRIIPDTDAKGNLTQWILDPKPGPGGKGEGRGLDVNEVVQFQLQPPDQGYLPSGLVESAIMKAQLSGAIDKHFATLVSGGGRLSGIISPKTGVIEDDGVFEQMVRDWRNITEQPESAKRVQVVRGPIDFTKTTASPVEMALVDFLKENRGDLFMIWGVPQSQVGGYTPAGLNSGDVRKYDRQAMWENAVIPRAAELVETVDTQILSRFDVLLGGWHPVLMIDLPTLEDDSPRFDKLQKAQFIALTNDERRDLVGKGPLEDQEQGQQILIPNTLVPIAMAGQVSVNPDGSNGPPKSSGPAQVEGAKPTASASSTDANAKTKQAASATSPVPSMKAKVVKGDDVTDAVVAALRKQWPAPVLATVQQGKWKFDPAYPTAKIDSARRPIARNPKIVQGVEAALNVGAPIDPVVLVKTKRIGGSHGLPTEPIDGWHRLLAAAHAGLDHVPAYIGSGDDAWTKTLIKVDDELPTPPDSPSPDEMPRATKATLRQSVVGLRQTVTSLSLEPLRASVASALATMKADVLARVRLNYQHLQTHPGDWSVYWKSPAADATMTAALTPTLSDVASTVSDHLAAVVPSHKASVAFGGPPASGVVRHVLDRGAGRVTKINEFTRDSIKELIAGGIEDGLSPVDLGDAIEAWSGWDEYRAERIATTELMFAYNAAATDTYREMGVGEVEAIDGDDDPECAERDGQTFSVDDAEAIEDHPNGTLDWLPIVSDEGSE
jgi:phage portal protein BeeE